MDIPLICRACGAKGSTTLERVATLDRCRCGSTDLDIDATAGIKEGYCDRCGAYLTSGTCSECGKQHFGSWDVDPPMGQIGENAPEPNHRVLVRSMNPPFEEKYMELSAGEAPPEGWGVAGPTMQTHIGPMGNFASRTAADEAKTLANGWVNIKGQGPVHNPELAKLVVEMHRLDRETFADVIEDRDPDAAARLREGAKSNVCPKCGASINPTQSADGQSLTGKCSSCGWSGTKRKTAKAEEECKVCGADLHWDGNQFVDHAGFSSCPAGGSHKSVQENYLALRRRIMASGENCPWCGQWGCSANCPGPSNTGVCEACGGTAQEWPDGSLRCTDPQGCGSGWPTRGLEGRRIASDDGSYGRNDAAKACTICGERILPGESGDYWEHATIGPRKDHEAKPGKDWDFNASRRTASGECIGCIVIGGTPVVIKVGCPVHDTDFDKEGRRRTAVAVGEMRMLKGQKGLWKVLSAEGGNVTVEGPFYAGTGVNSFGDAYGTGSYTPHEGGTWQATIHESELGGRWASKTAGSFEEGIARIQETSDANVLYEMLNQNERLRRRPVGEAKDEGLLAKLDAQDAAAKARLQELGLWNPWAVRRSSKITEIAKGICAANPGITPTVAFKVAAKTVARFPKVAAEDDDPPAVCSCGFKSADSYIWQQHIMEPNSNRFKKGHERVAGTGLNSDFGEVRWGKCLNCRHDESRHRTGEHRACDCGDCPGFALSPGKDAARTAAVPNSKRDPQDLSGYCLDGDHDECEDFAETTCLCQCHDHWGVPDEYNEGWRDDQYTAPRVSPPPHPGREGSRTAKWDIGTYAVRWLSDECGPGGDGQCDGLCPDGTQCDCECHDGEGEITDAGFSWDTAGIKAWHESVWAPDGEYANRYAGLTGGIDQVDDEGNVIQHRATLDKAFEEIVGR